MLTPSSFAWASSSGGVVRSASASAAAGRTFSPAKSRTASWNICCSSSGARSKRPLGLPVFWRAGLPSFWAALKVRAAVVAERNPPFVVVKTIRSNCLRIPIRSSRLEPASLLSVRRATPMLRSPALAVLPFSFTGAASSRFWFWPRPA